MLAIARALVGGPKILLLDEPLEGLAPIVVENLFAALLAIRDNARVTIILAGQKVDLALAFAEDALVPERGRPRQDSRAAGGRSAATPIVGDRRTVTGVGSPKGPKPTWPLSARMGLRPNDPTIPILIGALRKAGAAVTAATAAPALSQRPSWRRRQ